MFHKLQSVLSAARHNGQMRALWGIRKDLRMCIPMNDFRAWPASERTVFQCIVSVIEGGKPVAIERACHEWSWLSGPKRLSKFSAFRTLTRRVNPLAHPNLLMYPSTCSPGSGSSNTGRSGLVIDDGSRSIVRCLTTLLSAKLCVMARLRIG